MVTRDIRYQMAGIATAYIRPHIRGADVRRAEAQVEETRVAIRAIVQYSVALPNLGERNVQPQERAREYDSVFLPLAMTPVDRGWDGFDYTADSVLAVGQHAAVQRSLLDAIRVAHPVIEEFVHSASLGLNAFELAFDQAILEILASIEAEHKEDFQIEQTVKEARRSWLRDGQFLVDFRSGEGEALDSLIRLRPYLATYMRDTIPTSEELMNMESLVIDRLRFAGEILDDLRPGHELYYKQLNETEEVNRAIRDKIQRARIALMIWERAHGELADGVTDPAKIDVGAMAGAIISAAGR